MKRPGDDGYDFPCSDSHSRIGYAYGLVGYVPAKPRFKTRKGYEVYSPSKGDVTKFKKELLEQIRICDMFLSNEVTK